MAMSRGLSGLVDPPGPYPPVIVVHGPLGSGKSYLLNHTLQAARQQEHLAVLTARCSPAEAHLPYAAVRQLVDAAAPDFPELAALRDGWAELIGARAASGGASGGALAGDVGGARPAVRTGATTEALEALHDALAVIARRAHPVLVLDDAEWADEPTFDFLLYALRRYDATPLTVVVVTVIDVPASGEDHVAALVGTTGAVIDSPRPMGSEEVRHALTESLGSGFAQQATVDAVVEQTEGSPLCVRAVIELLRSDGRSSPEALAGRVRRDWPVHLAGVVTSRLRPFGHGVVELVSALSVLRRPLPWDLAVRLLPDSGPAAETALRTARCLGVVSAGDVVVQPPLLARALREQLPTPVRERAERIVADLLVETGGPLELIAEHLLHTAAPGLASDIDHLEGAAHVVASPEEAAAFLLRALRGRNTAERRARLLTQLGTWELHFDGNAALHHLLEAHNLTTDPVGRARLALRLSHAHAVLGNTGIAVALLADEVATTPLEPEHALVRTLRAETFFVSLGDSGEHRRVGALALDGPSHGNADGGGATARGEHATARPPDRADDMLQAARSLRDAWSCRAASGVLDALSPALAHGPRTTDEQSVGLLVSGAVLIWADDLAGATVFYEDALTDARTTGSRLGTSISLWMQGLVALRRGRLLDAERLAREAADAVPGPRWGKWQHAPLVVLLPVLRSTGETARALDALRRAKGSEPLPDLWLAQVVRGERARLRLEAGDHRGALSDARGVARALTGIGCVNPAVSDWRLTQSLALHSLGDRTEALDLATEHLELARRWGAPSTTSTALEHVAQLVGGRPGLAHVDEAVSLVEDGAMPLVLAAARFRRGVLLVERGDLVGARAELATATELADAAGARVLAGHARAALVATGARPRVRSSVLSDAEARVAVLVLDGATNKAIAEELFLAQRTVETHLTTIYRKLGIGGRSELGRALDETSPGRPSGGVPNAGDPDARRTGA